jgi:hypothetical protein
VKERTDVIDSEKKQYMAHSEKKCSRIKPGRISFSPDSAVWIRRRQVYHSILRFHEGKIRNPGNLKQKARRCGIHRALRMSVLEVREWLKICEEKCDYYTRHGHPYRQKFLQHRLSVARIKRNHEAEKQILGIIEREKQRAFWRRLNYAMRKPQGRSVRVAQVEGEDGEVTEYDTQDSVENAIWSEIHGERFYLAEQTPICQGVLRGKFGYMAQTQAARQVLAGSYRYEGFTGGMRKNSGSDSRTIG